VLLTGVGMLRLGVPLGGSSACFESLEDCSHPLMDLSLDGPSENVCSHAYYVQPTKCMQSVMSPLGIVLSLVSIGCQQHGVLRLRLRLRGRGPAVPAVKAVEGSSNQLKQLGLEV
jgi:hypothetical protein